MGTCIVTTLDELSKRPIAPRVTGRVGVRLDVDLHIHIEDAMAEHIVKAAGRYGRLPNDLVSDVLRRVFLDDLIGAVLDEDTDASPPRSCHDNEI